MAPASVPFVVTTRYPTGAVSVTAIGRTSPGAFVEAEANVTQARQVAHVRILPAFSRNLRHTFIPTR